MSKFKVIASLMLTVILVAACAGPGAAPATPATPATPAAPAAPEAAPPAAEEQAGSVAPGTWLTAWADENLDNYRSHEEILELARQEGQVVIYSVSSRIGQVADAFMERYPGIEVEAHTITTAELIERFAREYMAGIRNADVLNIGDSDGAILMDFVRGGMLHVYQPYDIVRYIDPQFLADQMPFFLEFFAWYYNTEVFPDGAPITSWWDVTRPEWYGRIVTRHPLEHIASQSLWTTMFLYADEMAADYERVFGHPIELSPGAETAAHEFVLRFLANDPIYLTSPGEIIQSVGRIVDEPQIGWAQSSGFRRREDEGLPINMITELTPALGIPSSISLYITDEANNPNAAMLLVRFMTDYHKEGSGIFDTLGSWLPRFDIPIHEGNPPLSDLNFWQHDLEFLYYNVIPMTDFVRLNLGG